DLPTYAFEHERYWLELVEGRADVASAGLDAMDHPLLGAVVHSSSGEEVICTGRWSARSHPWLKDHDVLGTVILPGTAFVELAVRAGDEAGYERLEELVLHAPLVIPEQGTVQVQVVLSTPDASGRRPVSVHSRLEGTTLWTRHAEGTLTPGQNTTPADGPAIWPPATATPLTSSPQET
ncbi:polyketide synthase dehydratase domain-containing protein, partial [Streptomyces sp. TBY4]|uniref:polyketide synthase dehydratase domain-containing protein n=1 Tax=Streptomyces sp. TBY4 TaxID=2962030 RepID=UPI0020B65AEE